MHAHAWEAVPQACCVPLPHKLQPFKRFGLCRHHAIAHAHLNVRNALHTATEATSQYACDAHAFYIASFRCIFFSYLEGRHSLDMSSRQQRFLGVQRRQKPVQTSLIARSAGAGTARLHGACCSRSGSSPASQTPHMPDACHTVQQNKAAQRRLRPKVPQMVCHSSRSCQFNFLFS